MANGKKIHSRAGATVIGKGGFMSEDAGGFLHGKPTMPK